MYNNLQIPKAELHSECCGKGFIVNNIKSIWSSNEYGLLLDTCKKGTHGSKLFRHTSCKILRPTLKYYSLLND